MAPRRLAASLLAPLLLLAALPACPLQARPLRLSLAQTELRLYSSPAAFRAHMAARVAAAMAEHPDLIVLPEDIGLPLLLVDDYALVKGCQSVQQAIGRMLAAYSAQTAALCQGRKLTPLRALLTLKAPRAAQLYGEVFAGLARQHRVYITAGSTPALWQGRPANVAYLFAPDGTIRGRTPKRMLVPLERGLELTRGPVPALQPWPTPLGTLGMLVCADAFYPRLAASLRQQGAQVLLNCNANPECWQQVGVGFQAASLPARVAETGLPGAQCFAVGHLFELAFEGRSQLLQPDGAGGCTAVAGAATCSAEDVVTGTLQLP